MGRCVGGMALIVVSARVAGRPAAATAATATVDDVGLRSERYCATGGGTVRRFVVYRRGAPLVARVRAAAAAAARSRVRVIIARLRRPDDNNDGAAVILPDETGRQPVLQPEPDHVSVTSTTAVAVAVPVCPVMARGAAVTDRVLSPALVASQVDRSARQRRLYIGGAPASLPARAYGLCRAAAAAGKER